MMWRICHWLACATGAIALGVISTAAHSGFAGYPSFGDTLPTAPQIEAVIDKGLIVELYIRCDRGIAIVTYSKVERAYCGPRHACSQSRPGAARSACGRA
jgi:hypothetical protein